jgi:hypothetical protein
MTYYEEDKPTEEDWIERIKTSIENDKSAYTTPLPPPLVRTHEQERHEELMEMLGGIFVQLSRVYDTLMFVVSPEHQKVIDEMHRRGELFASPPTLVEKAWGEDEAVSDKD